MLRTKPRKRKNPSSKNTKDQQRKIDEFVASGKISKLSYKDPEVTLRKKRVGDLKFDFRCDSCGGWEDSKGNFQHYDWCPRIVSSSSALQHYKKWDEEDNRSNFRRNPTKRLVRKNPISTRKSSKQYKELIQLDIDQTSRSHIVLNHKGKEIEFTGKDAEELRDIMKYQLKLFRESSRLQKLYPGNLDNSGGYDTYITEILKDIYPKVFK